MKFNEKTLVQTIEDLKMDIMKAKQDLETMKLHKADLEHELKMMRLTPDPHAIKNALKISRLIIYARDLTPLPTTKVPSEFSPTRIQHDIECIDGWLNDEFKNNDNPRGYT